MMRQVTLYILLAGLLAGCQSASEPTPKELALQKWNSARSGVLLNMARDQYTNGDFDKARDTVDQALQMNPKDAALHIMSAKIAIEQAQLEVADAELNAARTIDPKLAEADYLSGVVYQRWQQPAKALIFYQHACEAAPNELSYLMAKTETLVSLNRQDEALALLQDRADFFEHNPVIHDEMGLILLQQHKIEQAVDMFRWAIILAPDDLTIREHLSLALFQVKRYGEAEMNIQRLVKNDTLAKRGDLFLTLAECQLALDQPAQARISAQTACDLNASSSTAWLTLAKISLQLNDTHRAEAGLTKALALDPNSSQVYLLMGYLRLRQNNFDEALTAFRQASRFDPTDTTSLCMSGYVLEKMSRSREAAAYYKQALKLDPHDPMATQFMANIAGD